MKLPPAAAYASRTANEASSSAVQPKTLPPRQRGKTSRSVPSSLAMGAQPRGFATPPASGGAGRTPRSIALWAMQRKGRPVGALGSYVAGVPAGGDDVVGDEVFEVSSNSSSAPKSASSAFLR